MARRRKDSLEPIEQNLSLSCIRRLVPCHICGWRPTNIFGTKLIECPGCHLKIELHPQLTKSAGCRKLVDETLEDTIVRDWNAKMAALEDAVRHRSNQSHTVGSAGIKDSDYDYTGEPDESSRNFAEDHLAAYDTFMNQSGQRRLGYGNRPYS